MPHGLSRKSAPVLAIRMIIMIIMFIMISMIIKLPSPRKRTDADPQESRPNFKELLQLTH